MAQDRIYIYGSDGTQLATISQVIDSNFSERLTGELTLSFVTTAERIPAINAETEFEFRGQYYRAVQVQHSISDGAFLVSVSCEQESIALVDDEIELFDHEGTADGALAALLAGTGITATAEYTGVFRVRMENTNRRAVLTEICGICGAEIEYNGHTIRLVNRRGAGSGDLRNLADLMPWTDFSETADLRDGTVSYEVSGADPDNLILGETVRVVSRRFGISAQKRIVGISYNPFNCTEVQVEVGDYVPDILASYRDTLEENSDTREKAETALEQAGDSVKYGELSAKIEKYISDETGRASIIATLQGTYVEPSTLNGYTKKTELSAEIGAYIDTQAGTAKIVNNLTGTFVKPDALGSYVAKTDLNAGIESYIDTTTGKAKLVSAVSGTYVSQSSLTGTLGSYAKKGDIPDVSGFLAKTELSAEIGAYIDTQAGTAKIVNNLTGTFVKPDALGSYVAKTDLNAGIETYIDTSTGKAKLVSAVSGTYATKSSLSDYVQTTSLNTSIGSYIDSTTGKAKVVSAVSGTYQTISGMSEYAKTSAITTIEQSITSINSSITLSAAYTNNTIGTNVYALLQLVSNPNSSNIQIQANKIDFTGFTTFLRASDLGSSGTTSIDGGRIKTGTISADRIDTSSIALSDVYGKGIYANYLMITSSGHYMYIGSDITTTNGVYESIDIRSKTLGFSNTSARGLVMDHANKVFRPNSSSATGGYSLGTSTYQWNNLYVNKIYLNGTELSVGTSMAGSSVTMGGSTSYYIICNTSRELRPYSTSTTYPCYLGTSSYYWHYAYIGSNTASIGSSASSKIGFFGTTPVTRKTVSSSANVATLITALKAYGLIA